MAARRASPGFRPRRAATAPECRSATGPWMRPRSPLKDSRSAETFHGKEPTSKAAVDASSKLDALYRRHARSVARWAYLLGGPALEPEDVMQEVFVIAHRELASCEAVEGAGPWLHRITLNVVRNRRRKERARALLYRFGAFARLVPDSPAEPIRLMEQRDTHARVYRILDRLNERHRAVLILFELEGLSGDEVARRLDVKTSTVWVWLHRARARFLKLLAAEGESR
ncbi:MAG: RNA polymerase sigma factor [Myxococcales bacterium]